ncbi:NmrA family NAD(P)-binding protein [Fulvivirgaceae bacterium BMA12]|uniref:NmrA family NAD(P)-binding protein n=1 Tax=Agaribacillus aureus TaxID=3051825 RepID=A0ABT8LED3_9BACT|nr:NmrA family NAD(P)-binding protein [Fulvivirgaceae bacterium BMA12]
MKSKILITAANGHTGYPAARELLRLGFPVRAFVRNADAATARELKKQGAEIFAGDIQDIRDVRKALEDIERAYFVPTYPNVLFQGATFASAARELALKHVVLVSQWLSANAHPSVYTKEHWLVDDIFRGLETTGLTMLNPGLFGFAYFMTPQPLAQFGIFPDFGSNAPPSNEDIGLVAAHILKDPGKHVGKTYRVTGRELLSAPQMADVIGKVLGRNVKVMELPEKMLLKVLGAMGYPRMDISQVRYYIREGQHNTWNFNAPTSVVRDIVGKEADDFETIVRRYLLPHPMANQTFVNKIKAMIFMIKAMLTPSWDPEKFEKEQGFPVFKHMTLSGLSKEWKATHVTNNFSQKKHNDNYANFSN